MATFPAFFDTIRTTLVEMGDEALCDGRPYGLRGYPDFHREMFPGKFSPSRWEEPISAGLSQRLTRKGFNSAEEVRYPFGGRCDLVIQLSASERLWIEVKTAFRPCLRPVKSPGARYAYDYEGDNLYDPGGDGSWKAGVADVRKKDILKLQRLSRPEADHIGILLLGFDKVSWPLRDDELYERLPPELDVWNAEHSDRSGTSWADRYEVRARKGFRDRVWFWHRPVA